MADRLQKILAAAGISSRRKAEELISGGHVSVNGHVVTELGTKADPRMDEIRVDGQLIGRPERHVYFMLYKPKGYVTTLSDPEGRETITDLIKGVRERVFPVGRLDYMSEGLLLLTNDGDLMAKLTAAKTHVPKTYMVKVSGHPTEEQIQRLREGITLPPEPGLAGARGKKQPGVERRSFAVKTQPAEVELVRDQENPWYQVTLIEGRNRQIRRMFEEIGFHIEKIKRIRYGTLELNVQPGELRQLTYGEINELRKSMQKPYRIAPPKPRGEEQEGRAERRPRLTKAAQRGFPKPPKDERGKRGKFASGARGGASGARDERPRRFAPREGAPAREERPRRTREEGGEQRQSFGDRPQQRRPEFRERSAAAGDGRTRDRRNSFGPGKPPKRTEGEERPAYGDRGPRRERPFEPRGDRPSAGRGERPFKPRTEGRSFEGGERPNRSGGFDRGERPQRSGGFGGPHREGGDREQRGSFDRPRSPRGESRGGARDDRGGFGQRREGGFGSRSDRPRSDRPRSDRPRSDRPRSDRGPRNDRGPSRDGERGGERRGPGGFGGSRGPRPGGRGPRDGGRGGRG